MKRTSSDNVALVAVALLMAFLMSSVAACGSDAAPSEGQDHASSNARAVDVIEPSQLISQDEAESIIGHALDTAEDSEQERVGLKQRFYGSSDDLEAFLQVSLTQQAAMPPEQTQTPEDLYRAITENFDDAVKVEGIGEEACFATPGLHILEKGYYILVAVGNLSVEANREKLKEGGRVAVGNLRTLLE